MKRLSTPVLLLAALCIAGISLVYILSLSGTPVSTISEVPVVTETAQVSGSLGQGLVAYYTLDSASGADASGNGVAATLSNVTAGAGKIGGGATFNGSNSTLISNPNLGSSAVSVSFWLNTNGYTGTAMLAEASNNYNNSLTGFSVFYQAADPNCRNGNVLWVGVKGNVGYNEKCYTFPGSGWHHYVAVLDKNQGAANEVNFYIDGSLASPVLTQFTSDNTGVFNGPVYFMSRGGSSLFAGGNLDDVRIYNRALSASDVSSIVAYTGSTGGTGGGTADTTPPVISNVISANVTTSGATISWSTDENSDSQVEYGLTAGYGSNTTLDSTMTTSHSQAISGLTAGTVYHYHVKSKDAAGNLATSQDGSFTTQDTAGTGGTAASFNPGDRVQVTTVPSAYGGSLQVRSGPGLAYGSLGTQAIGNQGTIISGPTFSDGLAWWNINYDNAPDGYSVDTYLVKATTAAVDTTPPSVPTGLVVSAKTATSITLSWNPSADASGIGGYKIFRCAAKPNQTSCTLPSSTGANDFTTVGTATAFTDSNLRAGATYGYFVEAYDASSAHNASGPSNSVYGTTGSVTKGDTTPPSAPTGLTATAVSSSEIDLSWNASTDNVGVVGYKVYRNGSMVTNVTGATSFKNMSGLLSGTSYTYTVSAYDAVGNNSAQSNAASAATLPSGSTKFNAGDRVQVSVPVTVGTSVNVHAAPGTSGALLGTQTNGALGSIVSSASNGTSLNGYFWWDVNFDSGVDGWVVEDYIAKYTAPNTYTVTVTTNGTGSGSVTCGGTACPSLVNAGTALTLSAAASANSTFGGWSGACSGTSTTCSLTVNANTSVAATFNATVVSGGNTHYVSTTGSAAWTTCTSSTAATCSLATANSNASAGDTVIIAAGTYSGNIAPAKSGTASSPITFMGNGRPLLTGSPVVAFANNSYIVVDGIVGESALCQPKTCYIDMNNGDNNIIRNSTFDKVTAYGSGNGYPAGVYLYNGSSNNQFLNNTIKSAGYYGSGETGYLIWVGTDANSPTDASNNNLFGGNELAYGGHHVLLLGSSGNVVENNYIHNEEWASCTRSQTGGKCGMRNIIVDGNPTAVQHNVIQNNFIGSSGLPADINGSDSINIRTDNNIVRGNKIIDGDEAGVNVATYQTYHNASGNHIYNNDFIHNGYAAFDTTAAFQAGVSLTQFANTTVTGEVIKNNIFWQDNRGQAISYCGATCGPAVSQTAQTVSNNLLDNVNPQLTSLPSSYPSATPLSQSAFNFTLQSGSPAIDAGGFLTTASAGSGSTITVADAGYFSAGIPGIVAGDTIQLQGQTQTARITAISGNTLTLGTSLPAWGANTGVSLPYSGTAPDIGAVESGFTGGGPTTYSVSISVTPAGAGTVTCGGTACPSTVASGASLTLTVTPNSGYIFGSWGGACSGTSATCVLSGIASNQSVTANFTANQVSTKFNLNDRVQTTDILNVRTTPTTLGTLLGSQILGALGTVIGGPVYANSYNWWNINYDSGVDGWSVEDYLVKFIAQTYSVTVNKSGTGSGTATCVVSATGGACPAAVNAGTAVTFSASAASGSTFGGWSGACSGTASTCSLSVNGNTTVTATFNAQVVTGGGCTVTVNPDYASVSGAVNSQPEGSTICVNPGSATWNQTLNITKGIILKGAAELGTGVTTITGNFGRSAVYNDPSGYVVYYNASDNSPFRLAGFTFNLNNNSGGFALHNNSGSTVWNVRVDHNTWQNAIFYTFWTGSNIYGVIDSNTFTGYMDFAALGNQASDWANLTYDFGTNSNPDNLYYEDNTFNIACNSQTGYGGWGNRYAMRYNTYNYSCNAGLYPLFDLHGNQGGGVYAGMGAEFYGNLVNTSGGNSVDLMFQRGGKIVYFGNLVAGGDNAFTQIDDECLDSLDPPATNPAGEPQHPNNSYYWNNRYGTTLVPGTANATIGDAGHCGTSISNNIQENRDFWNQNAGCTAASCTAGIGSGPVVPTGTCTAGTGYWVTSQSIGSINSSSVGRNASVPISGTLYQCNSSGRWASYWTPLSYPHPLRVSGPLSGN